MNTDIVRRGVRCSTMYLQSKDLPPILPTGTAVVIRADMKRTDGATAPRQGDVAVIVRAPADPEHGYRVRFPGGEEATLHRRDMWSSRTFSKLKA